MIHQLLDGCHVTQPPFPPPLPLGPPPPPYPPRCAATFTRLYSLTPPQCLLILETFK